MCIGRGWVEKSFCQGTGNFHMDRLTQIKDLYIGNALGRLHDYYLCKPLCQIRLRKLSAVCYWDGEIETSAQIT